MAEVVDCHLHDIRKRRAHPEAVSDAEGNLQQEDIAALAERTQEEVAEVLRQPCAGQL